MQLNRPIVLSIAGYDPSGGAGLLADIKTFEQHKVYGIGIVSALTFQTENKFFDVKWTNEKEIIKQVQEYLKHFQIKVVKFGIMQNWKVLNKITAWIKDFNDKIKIVVDPILKPSAGNKAFLKGDKKMMVSVLKNIDLLTPNYDEAILLSDNKDGITGAKELSKYCNIFLKGGHNPKKTGTDYLFINGVSTIMEPKSEKIYSKHGSGCVLSAAIAANLALGQKLPEACKNAKQYTEKFLNSNKSLLGYHV